MKHNTDDYTYTSPKIQMISDADYVIARKQEMERDILPGMMTRVVLPRSKKTVTIYSKPIKSLVK